MRIASETLKALIERPPQSEEWRKQRDAALKERGIDPAGYDSA